MPESVRSLEGVVRTKTKVMVMSLDIKPWSRMKLALGRAHNLSALETPVVPILSSDYLATNSGNPHFLIFDHFQE